MFRVLALACSLFLQTAAAKEIVDHPGIVGGVALPDPKIIGGNAVQSDRVPDWMVFRHDCGASLIDDWWIVSAAHCSFQRGDIIHLKGWNRTDASETVVKRVIKDCLVHPEFERCMFHNDITMCQLTMPVPSDLEKIKIASESVDNEYIQQNAVDVQALGWGMTSTSNFAKMPDILHSVTLNVVQNEECSQSYAQLPAFGEIRDDEMCASKVINDGSGYVGDTCQGDSGGPLFFYDNTGATLVGIASHGSGCALAGYPGIYARVASFSSWLYSNLRSAVTVEEHIVTVGANSFGEKVVMDSLTLSSLTYVEPGGAVTYEFLASSGCDVVFENDVQVHSVPQCGSASYTVQGNPYESCLFGITTPCMCAQACYRDPVCTAYTFSGNSCELYSGTVSLIPDVSTVGGVAGLRPTVSLNSYTHVFNTPGEHGMTFRCSSYELELLGLSSASAPRLSSTVIVKDEVQQLSYSVARTFPHSKDDFTQGLFYAGTDLVLESTGNPNYVSNSKVMWKRLSDGQVIKSYTLPRNEFGEGSCVYNNYVVMLTWKMDKVYVFEKENLTLLGTAQNPASNDQGWGITTNGEFLIHSDGSATIYFSELSSRAGGFTLAAVRTISVTLDGADVTNLNELEYIDGYIYANRWQTNLIYIIDPRTGHVVSYLDLTALDTNSVNCCESGNVLNGIAFIEETGEVLVTGKKWSTIFALRIDDRPVAATNPPTPLPPSTSPPTSPPSTSPPTFPPSTSPPTPPPSTSPPTSPPSFSFGGGWGGWGAIFVPSTPTPRPTVPVVQPTPTSRPTFASFPTLRPTFAAVPTPRPTFAMYPTSRPVVPTPRPTTATTTSFNPWFSMFARPGINMNISPTLRPVVPEPQPTPRPSASTGFPETPKPEPTAKPSAPSSSTTPPSPSTSGGGWWAFLFGNGNYYNGI